ncbi:hypothetical protein [Pseudomonas sp. SED1]|uniref:hypothetical protein n=1 Tax=Pseudomonas sp. SED1 TaxID=3056845 RepID=UPI00296E92DF|nr:hypothetical protein [Pseudomonas sp. SED1]MDY0834189.1 hypothetical protein [Pseudomonas sp. SED1]
MKVEYFSNMPHESVVVDSLSYRLNSFPPPDDFPMVCDAQGNVISRYDADYYDYSLIYRTPLIVRIANSKNQRYPIGASNQDLLRKFSAYMQFGDVGMMSPRSMAMKVDFLRKIIYFCESKSIDLQSLHKFPFVQIDLIRWLIETSPSKVRGCVVVFKTINEGRRVLNFNVFDSAQLAAFEELISDEHATVQTPYIPSRIWKYQLSRLDYFLRKYLEHQEIFEKMYQEILEAYVHNCGSIEVATRSGAINKKSPFSSDIGKSKIRLGSFSEYAKSKGVHKVISELIYDQVPAELTPCAGAKPFGRYFNALTFIGKIYLINYSGMRVSEAAGLRADAFYSDIIGSENVCFLKGETSKTIRDDNALWVTSSMSEKAIRVMTSIARLRMKVAKLDTRIDTPPELLENPYLEVYGLEPWLPSKKVISERSMGVRSWLTYGQWRQRCPGLFEENQIKITVEDLNEALLATPNLDVERYGVGQSWSFAYHQLRRTLYVNACRSSLVTERSGQWQLKQLYVSMTNYYGRNYSSIELNNGFKEEFLGELHKQLAFAALELNGENYVSLLSEKHKQSVLSFLNDKDVKKLIKLVSEGRFSFRKNLLGLCFSNSPCQYGGFDNIVNCNTCKEGLVDKGNLAKLERFIKLIAFELEHELKGSPRYESLEAQYRVAANVIEVITIG